MTSPASCSCEPQRIVGGCAICNGSSVVSDARLDELIEFNEQEKLAAFPLAIAVRYHEQILSALHELRQLRALAQTRQFGEREG